MKYLADVEREGTALVVTFPDCPGCLTQVDEGEDLYAMAREALEGWLEASLAHGEAPPRPRAAREIVGDLQLEAIDVSPALAVRIQLRWARQEAGLSQSELASRVGVTRQAIAQLESPDANLRLSTLERVASALGQRVSISLQRPSGAAVHREAPGDPPPSVRQMAEATHVHRVKETTTMAGRGQSKVTSKSAANSASKVLRAGRTSKDSKAAAGSALSQRPGKKKGK